MDTLFTLYEVTFTVPAAEPLAAVPAGTGVTAVLTAETVSVTVTVGADRPAEAGLLGEFAAGPVSRMAGAEMSVKPVPA